MLGTSDAWSFVPANQQTNVLYSRLSDFRQSLLSKVLKLFFATDRAIPEQLSRFVVNTL